MKLPVGVKLVLMLVGATVLQAAFGSSLRIAGVQPDFNKMVLIGIAVNVSAPASAAYGFVAGWLMGATVGVSVGSYIVSRMTMAWLLGLLEARLVRHNPVVLMFSALTGSMLCEAIFFLFSPQPEVYRWLKQAVGESVYTVVFVLPITAWVRRLLPAGTRLSYVS